MMDPLQVQQAAASFDPTTVMLDQMLRVLLSEALRAGVWVLVFYPVLKWASKHL